MAVTHLLVMLLSLCLFVAQTLRVLITLTPRIVVPESPLEIAQLEQRIPKNKSAQTDGPNPDHFSACLLYKDDNKLFPEWLAYHATVLPLKRLIIAADPFSLTSPKKILDDYSSIINSTIWTDEDYMFLPSRRFQSRPVYTMNVDGQPLTSQRKYNSVVWRQIAFYRKCLEKLHDEGQGWTVFIDSDEYLTYHYYSHDEAQTYCASKTNLRDHYSGRLDVCLETFHLRLRDEEPRRFEFPLDMTSQTIAQYLRNGGNTENKACFIMPILPIGPDERHSFVPPPGFNQSSFYTYRFLNHAKKYNHMPGKGMVHVGRTTRADYRDARPHQILKNSSICGNGNNMDRKTSLFHLNHYSGPLQDFLSRPGDAHRTEEAFKMRTGQPIYGSLNASSMDWLPGFVRMVGSVERAKQLTEGLQMYVMENDDYSGKGPLPFFPSEEYVAAYTKSECERIRRESKERNRSAGLCSAMERT